LAKTSSQTILENRTFRLLIVDDEPDICSALTQLLTLEGYVTNAAQSGQRALDMLVEADYDLMILDMWMPPGMDGIEVISRVRQLQLDLPIIILTGRATLDNAIAAAKAEKVVDYLLKPAKQVEILNAIRRGLQKRMEQLQQQRLIEAAGQILEVVNKSEIMRESLVASKTTPGEFLKLQVPVTAIIRVPPLTLNRTTRTVTIEHKAPKKIELSKGETAVLIGLMSAPGKTLSCRELSFAAWGYDIRESDAAPMIRPYISRLRKKLEPDPSNPTLIRTVRGHGYRLHSENPYESA
jgi:DNA-binding response OmpR family regulator